VRHSTEVLRDLLVGEGLRTSYVMEHSADSDLLAILEVGASPGAVIAAASWAWRKQLAGGVKFFHGLVS